MAEPYAEAFSVDRGRHGCWRYVVDGGGRPQRCPGEVAWAGLYTTRQRRWRVWSCAEHLAGGERWVARPAGCATSDVGRRRRGPGDLS